MLRDLVVVVVARMEVVVDVGGVAAAVSVAPAVAAALIIRA